MKTFVAVFIALAAISATAASSLAAGPSVVEFGPPLYASFKTGPLLKQIITTVFDFLIEFLSLLTPVAIKKLLLITPTSLIDVILTVIGCVIGVNLTPYLAILLWFGLAAIHQLLLK